MKVLQPILNLLLGLLGALVAVLLLPFIILFRLASGVFEGKPGYLDIYGPHEDRLNFYDGPEAWDRAKEDVPGPAVALYAVHWANLEIANGGFWQYFYNSTGLTGPEARDGFLAIGMPEAAELLQRAMDRVGTPFPRERQARQARVGEPDQRLDFPEEDRFVELVCNPKLFGGAPVYYPFADAYAARVRAGELS